MKTIPKNCIGAVPVYTVPDMTVLSVNPNELVCTSPTTAADLEEEVIDFDWE